MARCVALRHHDARVGGSVPELGSFNTVTQVSAQFIFEVMIPQLSVRIVTIFVFSAEFQNLDYTAVHGIDSNSPREKEQLMPSEEL